MKQFVFIITIFSISLIGYSQESPYEIVEQFFKDFKEQGSQLALDRLYQNNKWINSSNDAVINLKNQMNSLTEDYVGKYYGYELIVEKKLNDSFLLLSYLIKYDRQPLRFVFKFYKPNDKWVVYGFLYDANIGEEIEESARLYNFRLGSN